MRDEKTQQSFRLCVEILEDRLSATSLLGLSSFLGEQEGMEEPLDGDAPRAFRRERDEDSVLESGSLAIFAEIDQEESGATMLLDDALETTQVSSPKQGSELAGVIDQMLSEWQRYASIPGSIGSSFSSSLTSSNFLAASIPSNSGAQAFVSASGGGGIAIAHEHNSGGPPVTGDAGGKPANGGKANSNYDFFISGNKADVAGSPSGGLALVGGSTDVESAFVWMANQSGGGDFVVLAASGNGIYNNYISRLAPSLDSVSTLVIKNSVGANDPFVAETIAKAEAIFIAGGDQSLYTTYWKGTATESAIKVAMGRGAVLGGTSAGLAVLGEFDYTGENGSITSAEALATPTDSRITINSGFITPDESPATPLRFLNNVITDSHFQQRDRMGRLVTFLSRLDSDGLVTNPANPRGIGINEQTALVIDAEGNAKVMGNAYAKNVAQASQLRSVFLLEGTTDPVPGLHLNYASVRVLRADYNPTSGVGDSFSLTAWLTDTGSLQASTGIEQYSLSATNGVLSSTQTDSKIY